MEKYTAYDNSLEKKKKATQDYQQIYNQRFSKNTSFLSGTNINSLSLGSSTDNLWSRNIQQRRDSSLKNYKEHPILSSPSVNTILSLKDRIKQAFVDKGVISPSSSKKEMSQTTKPSKDSQFKLPPLPSSLGNSNLFIN